MRLVNFYWKDHDLAFGGGPEDGKQLGWIAQEVQSVSHFLLTQEEDYIDNDAHPDLLQLLMMEHKNIEHNLPENI